MDAIICENVVKEYSKIKAVDGISLSIKKGEIYGLIGRNGAGKTTLLKMMAGLVFPSSGEVVIENSGYEGRKTGLIIENPGLYKQATVINNLKILSPLAKADKADIESILRTVDLWEYKGRKAAKLSQGMKQRLGIAMSLLGNPQILLLDEPFNGLDPEGIVLLRRIIHRVREKYGTTIIVSSHILEEIHKLVDRCGYVESGKLVAEFAGDVTTEDMEKLFKKEVEVLI